MCLNTPEMHIVGVRSDGVSTGRAGARTTADSWEIYAGTVRGWYVGGVHKGKRN